MRKVLACLVIGLALTFAFIPCNVNATDVPCNYTGGQQTWVVPTDVTSIEVDAKGAGGGGGYWGGVSGNAGSNGGCCRGCDGDGGKAGTNTAGGAGREERRT